MKLEGSAIGGYQTIAIAGIRDPHVLVAIDTWTHTLHAFLIAGIQRGPRPRTRRVPGWIYGATDGTPCSATSTRDADPPREVGVVLVVTAADQALATNIAKYANPYLLHMPLPGMDHLPSFAFMSSPRRNPTRSHLRIRPPTRRRARLTTRPRPHRDERTVTTISSRTVGDVATLVRSKNAGPFWLTLDVFCATDNDYVTIADNQVINPERIGDLYHVEPATIRIYRIPALRVVKVSFPRPTTQGGINDRDMHAGQQHVPLSRLPLPT